MIKTNNFVNDFIYENIYYLKLVDQKKIQKICEIISQVRENNGTLYILGVGGSAAHASHACNDFRKLCNINACCPTDNISELTARTNDEGWETFFREYLKVSNLNQNDLVLIFSVGGGSLKKKVSINLINAIRFAKKMGAQTISITGKENGYCQKNTDLNLSIINKNSKNLTPIGEGLTAIIWHCIVTHPILKINKTKW